MTISKALPIRLWLNGQETFNEKEVPGIDEFLFAQKFNKSDSIKLQIIDTEIKAYFIEILDKEDTIISTTQFIRETISGSYVYSISLDFSSLETGCYYLRLITLNNEIVGTLTGGVGIISGTITNSSGSVMFEIVGNLLGKLGSISGTIVNDPCYGCTPYGAVSPAEFSNCRNEGGTDYYDQLYHDGCCGFIWVTIEGACP